MMPLTEGLTETLTEKLFLKYNRESYDPFPKASFYKYDSESDSFNRCKLEDLKENDIFLRLGDVNAKKNLFIAYGSAYYNEDKILAIKCESTDHIAGKNYVKEKKTYIYLSRT